MLYSESWSHLTFQWSILNVESNLSSCWRYPSNALLLRQSYLSPTMILTQTSFGTIWLLDQINWVIPSNSSIFIRKLWDDTSVSWNFIRAKSDKTNLAVLSSAPNSVSNFDLYLCALTVICACCSFFRSSRICCLDNNLPSCCAIFQGALFPLNIKID